MNRNLILTPIIIIVVVTGFFTGVALRGLQTSTIVGPSTEAGSSGPNIDGFATAFCSHFTNSCQATLSTSGRNDLIIVYTAEQLDLQTVCTFSLSDSAGLTWNFRSGISGHNDGTTGSNRDQMAEFWATSANKLTNDVVTESISGCASFQYGGEYNGLTVFGVSGANVGTPFDSNISLPAASSGSGSPSIMISTTSSKDLIIAGGQEASPTGQGALTAGPGFTLIASMNAGNEAAESQFVSSAVSGFPVSFGSNGGDWEIIADAVNSRIITTAPDFDMSATPTSLTLLIGTSGTSTISVSSINGFSGTVKLSASVSPAGVAASLNPSSVAVTSGGVPTSQLTVATTTSTPAGAYLVTVNGKSGKLTHTASVAVNVVTKISTPPALDGASNGFCGHDTNSCQAVLTTSSPNDVVIAYTVETLDLQTSCTFSVSDTAGLSWSFRAQATGRNDGTTGTNRDQLAEFWAISANPLVNDTITESIAGCAGFYGGEYNGLMVFGISGANTASPFDSNASLPAIGNSGFGVTASVQLSTSNPADMIIAGAQHGASAPTTGPGFTLITSNAGGPMTSEYETTTAAQNNITVSFGDAVSSYWDMVADAVQGA